MESPCKSIADFILGFFRSNGLDLIYHEREDEWTVFCLEYRNYWHFCYGNEMRWYVTTFLIDNYGLFNDIDTTVPIVDGIVLCLQSECTCFRFINQINHVKKLLYQKTPQYEKEEQERRFAKTDADSNVTQSEQP